MKRKPVNAQRSAGKRRRRSGKAPKVRSISPDLLAGSGGGGGGGFCLDTGVERNRKVATNSAR